MITKKVLPWILLIIVLIAGSFWLWQTRVQASEDLRSLDLRSLDPRSEALSVYEASGMLEARTVRLAPEIGGQITEVLVEEGQPVKTGQPLVKLDPAILEAQKAQASAAVRAAQANLALLKAGATREQIQAAEAQLDQAEASLQASQATLDTLTTGARPEDLAAARQDLQQARERYINLRAELTVEQQEKVRSVLTLADRNVAQITGHQADLEKDNRSPAFVIQAAKDALEDAQKARNAAQKAYEQARNGSQPFYLQLQTVRESLRIAESVQAMAQARQNSLKNNPQTTQAAQTAADSTLVHVEDYRVAAQAAYDELNTGLSADELKAAWDAVQSAEDRIAAFVPLTASSLTGAGRPNSVEALLAQIDAARASRDTAAANLSTQKNGARVEQLQAAQAQVDAAQAQVDLLDIQIKKAMITAPFGGLVITRSAEPGQSALPGGTLLEVGQLDQLDLTVYLPENQLGAAKTGQRELITVNAYPGRTFEGTVLRIASEAEFTPGNVQSKEDRSRLVYAVVIRINNPDLALKPGMIGDVAFR